MPELPSIEMCDALDEALQRLWAGDALAIDSIVDSDTETPWPGVGELLDRFGDIGESVDVDGYEVLGEIGRGAMSVVYHARSIDGNEVALKLLRSDGAEQSRLHEREIQTLARLRHPNIAALHDAGEDSRGRRYIAMDHVRGRSLGRVIRDLHSGSDSVTREKILGLFLPICEAVGHAHQRGVIHRDLKPSNVMVDADDRPHVLDFGLARICDLDRLGTTIARPGYLMGTVPYMSPEQAAGRAEEVDVRSDVYSLGVILYELTTGRLPHDVRSCDLPEAITMICRNEPTRPGKVGRIARGDLETIILKTLEKSPERRYQSVTALADDLRRMRDGDVILARRPSLGYQLRRLAGRHRVASGLLVLFIASLIAFATVTKRQAYQISKQRDEAGIASFEARRAEARAKAVQSFLTDMLTSIDPADRNKDITVREVLDDAVAELESDHALSAPVEAAVRTAIGKSYIAIGMYPEARPHMERSLQLKRSYLEPGDPELADGLLELADVLHDVGAFDEALPYLQDALDILESASEPGRPGIARVINDMAIIHHTRSRHEEAEALYRTSLAMRQAALGSDHADVAVSHSNLGALLRDIGKYDAARQHFEEALRIQEQSHGGESLDYAAALMNFGQFLVRIDSIDEGAARIEQAYAIRRERLDPDDPTLVLTLHSLAQVAGRQGNLPLAIERFTECVDRFRRRLGPDHAYVGASMTNLSRLLTDNGDPQAGLDMGLDALPIVRAGYGESHWFTGECLVHIAVALDGVDRTSDALPYLEAALPIFVELYGEDHRDSNETRRRLIAAYEKLGRHDEVEAVRARSPSESSG